MKPLSLFILALMALLALLDLSASLGIPTDHDGLPEGYILAVATFHGEINGTISSALRELEQMHPYLAAPHNAPVRDTKKYGNSSTLDPGSTSLHGKRHEIWPPLYFSGGYRWETTSQRIVFKMLADALKFADGIVWAPGNSCIKLDCWGDATWWLCNDRPTEIRPNLGYLVSYARRICHYSPCMYDSYWWGMQCGGQFFDTDSYNIIVRRRLGNEPRC